MTQAPFNTNKNRKTSVLMRQQPRSTQVE